MQAPADRRTHNRSATLVRLRLRAGPRPKSAARLATADAVVAFEALGLAAQRWRRDLDPTGRQFVDRVVELADAVVGRFSAEDAESDDNSFIFTSADTRADLSLGGIGLQGPEPAPPLERVDVEFFLPAHVTSVPFRIHGRVVHTNPLSEGMCWVGIQFEEIHPRTQDRLSRALAEMHRGPGDAT